MLFRSSRSRLTPRHADDGCDLTQTYTATYTSDSVRTYTVLSVSTAPATYTSLRTSTRSGARARTVTATRTWTAYETQTQTQTQTITDYAPTATITVTATRVQTETDTLTSVSVASAAPSAAPGGGGGGGGGECNTGPIQCCDKVAPANSDEMSSIISAIGIGTDVLNGLGDGLVGTSCSPIDVLSLGGGVEWYVHRFSSAVSEILTICAS